MTDDPGPYGGQPPPGWGQPPPGYGQAPPPGWGQPPPPGWSGYPGQPGYGYPRTKTSDKAIWVLVLGIGSLVLPWVLCFFPLGLVPAVVGLCLAPRTRREIEASRGWITGAGQLKGGVICSWIGLALNILSLIFWVVVIVGFASADWSYYNEY